jgi:hypothetical protein
LELKNPLTRQSEQDQPIHNQHGPEDGEIENLKPGAEEANSNRLGRAVPELELWQPPHERPEFLLFLCGQPAGGSILHALILLERGVEFGRYEGQEQVQEVDAE